MLVIMAFLGECEIACPMELLTKNEVLPVLKLSGKIFVLLQKLVYLYQAIFLKEVIMDPYHLENTILCMLRHCSLVLKSGYRPQNGSRYQDKLTVVPSAVT
jgi:hypothetical protein